MDFSGRLWYAPEYFQAQRLPYVVGNGFDFYLY